MVVFGDELVGDDKGNLSGNSMVTEQSLFRGAFGPVRLQSVHNARRRIPVIAVGGLFKSSDSKQALDFLHEVVVVKANTFFRELDLLKHVATNEEGALRDAFVNRYESEPGVDIRNENVIWMIGNYLESAPEEIRVRMRQKSLEMRIQMIGQKLIVRIQKRNEIPGGVM